VGNSDQFEPDPSIKLPGRARFYSAVTRLLAPGQLAAKGPTEGDTGPEAKLPSSTLLLVIATLAVSFAPVFIKMCQMPAPIIAGARLLLTSLILLPFAWKHRHQLRTLSRFDLILMVTAGVLFGAHFLTFTYAPDYTSYESWVILLAVQPILAAVIGYWLLGERTTRGMWIAIWVGLVGMVMLVWEDMQKDLESGASLLDGKHLFGDFLVLLAGVTVVLAIIIGRRLRQKVALPLYTGSIFGVGGIVATSWALVAGHGFVGHSPEAWFWLLMLIAVPTFCGHTLFNYLVKHVRVIYLNMVILAEPVISMFAKYLIDNPDVFGKVDLGPLKLTGAVILIGSVGLALVLREKRTKT
jgi:drug/metabolite transporter (DMT)-like permease